MKAKWFLRGFGIGIIVTSLLLCVVYRNTSENTNVIKQAKELGMIFPEQSRSEEEPALTPKQEEVQAVTEQAVVVNEKEPTEEEKKAKKKLDDGKKDIKKVSKYQKETDTFVIRGGMLSSDVARGMKEDGIIEDSVAFNHFLESKGYGRQIRSGKYEIPKGANFEKIAKIITKQE